ncbi:uncharacterized protein [Nicotiana tomentosiformis]|uniref:uncharacterized protein n=1 Tax=Nicotiana tomentosiformis TaxID=4098 RepID=UPI00388CA7C1
MEFVCLSKYAAHMMPTMETKVNLSTTFHPQTDGQAERTIQTLEDMLRACVLNFKGRWDDHLPLIEFAYNNSFHASIQMALFEALYGRRCRSPVGWYEVGEAELIGLDLVHQAMEKVVGDPSAIVPVETIEISEELSYEEILVAILDRQVQKLRNKEIAFVNVLWRNQQVEEATWEAENEMKKKYPHLFE